MLLTAPRYPAPWRHGSGHCGICGCGTGSAVAPAAAFQIFTVVVLGPLLPTDIAGAGYQRLPPTWPPEDPGAHELGA